MSEVRKPMSAKDKRTLESAPRLVARGGRLVDQSLPELAEKIRRDFEQTLTGIGEPASAEGAELAESEGTEKRELSPEESTAFLAVLETRLANKPEYYKHPKGIEFSEVKATLETRPDLMWSLVQMENSKGVVDIRAATGNEFVFCDFAKEVPESRRDMTFPQIEEAAEAMGVDIQPEKGWRALQKMGKFDLNSYTLVILDGDVDVIGYPVAAYRFGFGRNLTRVGGLNDHSPNRGWRAELSVPKAKRRADNSPEFSDQTLAELAGGVRPDLKQAFSDSGKPAPAEGAKLAESEGTEKRELSPEESTAFLAKLEVRLTRESENYKRPEGIEFSEVKAALSANLELMWSLAQIENSGSIVDIRADEGNEFVFCDFAKEVPESRRDMTYFQAEETAEAMGVDIQPEKGWRALQKMGVFDLKSWIWLKSDDIDTTGFARYAYRYAGTLSERIFARLIGAGRSRDYITVSHRNAHYYIPRGEGGWRFELRVPKA